MKGSSRGKQYDHIETAWCVLLSGGVREINDGGNDKTESESRVFARAFELTAAQGTGKGNAR